MDSLGRENDTKRLRVFKLLSGVPALSHLRSEQFPDSVPEFNAYFMWERGARILNDIVYPGQWSVAALRDRFGEAPEVFRDMCRFKWAFNIKPDLVVLVPDAHPLCIEAKLESKESWYPSASKECAIFDDVFGWRQGRVGQLGLQRFMFKHILGDPCIPVVVGRTSGFANPSEHSFISWHDTFNALDLDSSHPYVEKLIRGNRHIGMSGP